MSSLSEFYMKKKSLFLRSFPSVSLNEQLEIEETKVNHPITFFLSFYKRKLK